MSVVEVIDNFLPPYQFGLIQSTLMGPNFEWYYNDDVAYNDDGRYQFIHGFYKDSWKSDNLSLLDLALQKLDVKKLYRVKANLNPRTVFHRNTGYHVDEAKVGLHKTAVYYINTNNGGTKFKKGKMVNSCANTMVIFDSHLLHAGITCTDEKRRVVINFNYI